MMQRNAVHADRRGTAFWTRLGVSAGLWLYVNAALLVWAYAYPWHLCLALAASTAAVVAAACAPASLLPVFAIAAAVLYWASALLIDGERHPGQALLAWSVISLVLVLAAGLTAVLGRRPAAAPAEPSIGPLPAGPDGEPAPNPASPRAPVPALHAGAEADPDED